MKMKSTLAFSLCAALGLAASLLHSGCESADTSGIEISQTSQEVKSVGQTVTLTASGWSGYLWTLEDPSYGRLNRTTGSTVIYTVTAMPETSKDITIKVAGTGTGVDASSTSNTSSMATGSTIIRHTVIKETPAPTTDTEKSVITVSPYSTSLTAAGQTVSLIASGGTKYAWELSDDKFGDLDKITGDKVTYKVYAMPSNAITVTLTVSDPDIDEEIVGKAKIRLGN